MLITLPSAASVACFHHGDNKLFQMSPCSPLSILSDTKPRPDHAEPPDPKPAKSG